MRLYPAIDIKDGKCVRLFQGQFDKTTVYNEDPVAVAKQWAAAGARYIHVVDLDGALEGVWSNRDVIARIVKEVNVPVQTGGGVRNIQDIQDRLDVGVDRVIIGTMAIREPEMVKHAVALFGEDKIVVGIDAKDGMVAISGWEEVSSLTALDVCKIMKSFGVKTIVYTDIAKDGTMTGPNLEQTVHLIRETGMDIVASGGVSSMEDLEKVAMTEAEGVIVGKALYTGAISLEEAVKKYGR
ncbi:1-(5-phosphoribosyl)-5-[(5-phosphoribosylamino)methylideneamino]imidazole-4-carboxamide isomerase [Anaerotalea alkaliphila]|uniref:1-(5-phosphoribosyl)-5-[(5-phosphoribosylamino)methylideneamino] imidazole-4-carboxamide isomerase n=1 Tax=Anaerotalea alkaliphila TaxID=2662126 RepID=A0A7X5HXZ3_9FIRM|nr:1-(5-phosphoribosyl)-5-[(5-phosphoribosylamino)methylideneamino]imidazole-4-carboxamide isomerase [Anaerotalea alkaliphila]NDL68680.1 1-(5-phosphoribosyl)-5-[(5-phosphoribosylamino)methylideneamino]imidazole-4-carboxamide isomerase [Anaerotalea alkaliphila]